MLVPLVHQQELPLYDSDGTKMSEEEFDSTVQQVQQVTGGLLLLKVFFHLKDFFLI